MSDDILKLGEQRAIELGILTVTTGRELRKDIMFDDLFRVLGAAKSVFSDRTNHDHHEANGFQQKDIWYTHHHGISYTDEALLIGVRPLVQESEERKLLRELVEVTHMLPGEYMRKENWLERAKALLEKP